MRRTTRVAGPAPPPRGFSIARRKAVRVCGQRETLVTTYTSAAKARRRGEALVAAVLLATGRAGRRRADGAPGATDDHGRGGRRVCPGMGRSLERSRPGSRPRALCRRLLSGPPRAGGRGIHIRARRQGEIGLRQLLTVRGPMRAALKLAMLALCAVAPGAGAHEDAREEANRKAVVEFYQKAINDKDFEAASKYLGPRYIQHNQAARD